MTKTQNYNLNKPEAGDPIRVADFNQNSDIIDAALKNLNTAVGNAGNCKIVTGSYVGTGTYGASNPNTLTFEFEPKVVFIGVAKAGNASAYAMMLRGQSKYASLGSHGGTDSGYCTWSENGVSWYSDDSDSTQLNYINTAYYYVVLA